MRSIHLWPLLLAPALGCELVANIEDRSVFAETVGGAGGAGGAGAGGQPSGAGGVAGAGAGGSDAGQGGTEPQGGAGSAGAAGESPGGAAGSSGQGGAAGDGGTAGTAGNGGTGAGTAGASGAAGSSGATCGFPTGSGTGLRAANLVPSTGRYDVCIKPKSDPDYSKIKPLLHADGCPGGLAYKQVSAGIDQAAGLYDVKFIASGAADCTDAGVGTLESVSVKSGAITDVFLIGSVGDFAPQRFTESVPQSLNNTAFRFVHAAKGVGNVDILIADGPAAPASAGGPSLFEDVAYLALPTSSPIAPDAVDTNGYLQVASPGPVNLGVADSGGDGTARLVRPAQFASNTALSLFLVGTPSDPRFPREALLCDSFDNDEQLPYLARCNGGQSFVQPTRFGTFNTQLTGIFSPYEPLRRPEVIKAAVSAADDVDVLCVGEAWAASDRTAIATATKAKFPFQAFPTSDEDTAIGDPTDQSGQVPTPFAEPPCVGANVTKLDSLISCLKDKCSQGGTGSAKDDATTVWGDCASSSAGCQGPFAGLLGAPVCFSCGLVQTQSYQKMSDIHDSCTEPTKKNRRFAFRGNNGSMLLSKNEILESELIMLPATEWRVGVVRAAVKLANDAVVDVYCTTLTTPATSFTRPYAGQYGDKQTGVAAWNAENKLQNQRLVALVHERSRYRRAVVLGELYTGPDYKDNGKQVTDSYTPDSWQVVLGGFGVAVAPDYKPACTQCASNPLVGGTKNYWASHALLFNAPVTSVSATSIGFTEPVVAVTDDQGKPQTVPLSTHYSLRTTVNFDP